MGRDATSSKLGFVGVTATASSITRVFPLWARELGLHDAELTPIDLPLDTSADVYRGVVRDIRDDPAYRGALVTAHKVKLLDATHELFDKLDPLAIQTGEISCISKCDGQLLGSAKDPITAGRSMEAFLGPGYFSTGAEVACLGAGGSGLAIALHLATREDNNDRPTRMILVNRERRRLDECRAVLGELDAPTPRFEYVQSADPAVNDRLIGELPPRSLVINATGLGKDRPGSPISDNAMFPRDGIVWELNYRGQLDFLHQARAQAYDRNLVVEDGWCYFVHGWCAVIAEVFDVELTRARIERLSELADGVHT